MARPRRRTRVASSAPSSASWASGARARRDVIYIEIYHCVLRTRAGPPCARRATPGDGVYAPPGMQSMQSTAHALRGRRWRRSGPSRWRTRADTRADTPARCDVFLGINRAAPRVHGRVARCAPPRHPRRVRQSRDGPIGAGAASAARPPRCAHRRARTRAPRHVTYLVSLCFSGQLCPRCVRRAWRAEV